MKKLTLFLICILLALSTIKLSALNITSPMHPLNPINPANPIGIFNTINKKEKEKEKEKEDLKKAERFIERNLTNKKLK